MKKKIVYTINIRAEESISDAIRAHLVNDNRGNAIIVGQTLVSALEDFIPDCEISVVAETSGEEIPTTIRATVKTSWGGTTEIIDAEATLPASEEHVYREGCLGVPLDNPNPPGFPYDLCPGDCVIWISRENHTEHLMHIRSIGFSTPSSDPPVITIMHDWGRLVCRADELRRANG